MSDKDEEFEDISNASQFTGNPSLAWEWVALKGVPTRTGRTPRVQVHELTVSEHADMQERNQLYKDGVHVGFNRKDSDFNLLASCVRDRNRNPIWQDAAEARAQLGKWGLSYKEILQEAINRVHGPKSVDEAEENLGETPKS